MERAFEIRRITRRRMASDFPGWSIGGGFQIRVPSRPCKNPPCENFEMF
jgi:hypothetical protein